MGGGVAENMFRGGEGGGGKRGVRGEGVIYQIKKIKKCVSKIFRVDPSHHHWVQACIT